LVGDQADVIARRRSAGVAVVQKQPIAALRFEHKASGGIKHAEVSQVNGRIVPVVRLEKNSVASRWRVEVENEFASWRFGGANPSCAAESVSIISASLVGNLFVQRNLPFE